MKPSLRTLLCCLVLAATASAGDASFSRVVDTLARRYQTRPMAGLGVATFFAGLFTPPGVHRLKLAVFDEVPGAREPAGEGELAQVIRMAVDPSYTPFIQVLSGPRHEATYIFLRDAGKRFDLLLVSAEPHEAVVMGMRLDPEALQKWVEDPEGMSRSCGKDLEKTGKP